MKLEGKTALVTGGGGGIGRATALALAREGAQVAVADIVVKNAEMVRDEIEAIGHRVMSYPVDLTKRVAVGDIVVKNAEMVRDEIKAVGRQVTAYQVDLTKRAEVEQMMESILSQFGQVDLLANCAGWDRLEPFVKSEEETWDRILAINFKSVLYTVKAILPHMISRGSGKIVNISSDAGRVGSSWEAVYSGAKGAVIAFSKSLAREVARHKINVNVICPGLTDTPLLQAVRSQSPDTEKLIDAITKATPFRRVARPEEVAEAVVFLSSPSADFITGQTLSVSGGLTMA